MASALRKLLPPETVCYLGDTARVPYGGKSQETIERYSFELTGLLLAEQAKLLVVACNTASALALPRLQDTLKAPVVGVIAPGAAAAAEATRTGRVGVIGTRATIASGAYERALHKRAPRMEIKTAACPLLVPLIEEGWLEHPVTDQVIRQYLEPLLAWGMDTLILGCTHYPLLKPALARLVGSEVALVDSAQHCAQAVQGILQAGDLTAPEDEPGQLEVALTDASDSFLRVAERALDLRVGDVQLRSVN